MISTRWIFCNGNCQYFSLSSSPPFPMHCIRCVTYSSQQIGVNIVCHCHCHRQHTNGKYFYLSRCSHQSTFIVNSFRVPFVCLIIRPIERSKHQKDNKSKRIPTGKLYGNFLNKNWLRFCCPVLPYSIVVSSSLRKNWMAWTAEALLLRWFIGLRVRDWLFYSIDSQQECEEYGRISKCILAVVKL